MKKILQTEGHAAILVFNQDNAEEQPYPGPPPLLILEQSCHKRQVIRLLGQGCVEGMRVQVSCRLWGLWRKAQRTS